MIQLGDLYYSVVHDCLTVEILIVDKNIIKSLNFFKYCS